MQHTRGEELENVLMSLLQKNNLDVQDVYGQGYNGAANMSRPYKGLQSRVLKQNPNALYVHCKAHSLNLVERLSHKVCREYALMKGISNCQAVPGGHATEITLDLAADNTLMLLKSINFDFVLMQCSTNTLMYQHPIMDGVQQTLN